MRFKGLDLNLLVAFNTLMETRSVSRAAERMNLSQPAVSAALGRLRAYFRDDILVSHGRRMYPTAFAQSLLPRIAEALHSIETLIATSAVFDPATSQRTFSIVASDYIMASVLVPLVARLAEVAPQIRIDIILPSDDSVKQLDEGKVDLLITPENFTASNHPSDLLFEERHLIVGWSGNPLFRGPISEADFFQSGHVAVSFGAHRTASFADQQFELMGKPRRVEVTVAFFTAVPWLLRDTLRLGLLHERLVRAIEQFFPIASAEIPFDFPAMREMVQYHRARADEPGLAWLRRQLEIVASGDRSINVVDNLPSKQ